MNIRGTDSASAKACVVFDVCNTLYRENTTFEFVRFYNRNRYTWRLFGAAVSWRISPLFWVLAVIYKVTGIDLPRRAIIASLANESEAALRREARYYVRNRLSAQSISMVHECLNHHRKRGDRIVLISNSVDIVIEAIAATFDVEWRASVVSFKRGLCTGRLETDLTGEKLHVAHELLSGYLNPPRLIVYTDNLSDRALVEAADEAFVIIPSDGNTTAWKGTSAKFIFDRL